jgi:hypothetical protein
MQPLYITSMDTRDKNRLEIYLFCMKKLILINNVIYILLFYNFNLKLMNILQVRIRIHVAHGLTFTHKNIDCFGLLRMTNLKVQRFIKRNVKSFFLLTI